MPAPPMRRCKWEGLWDPMRGFELLDGASGAGPEWTVSLGEREGDMLSTLSRTSSPDSSRFSLCTSTYPAPRSLALLLRWRLSGRAQCSIMKLISSILVRTDHLAHRMKLRDEFDKLGLNKILEACRAFSPLPPRSHAPKGGLGWSTNGGLPTWRE